MHRLLLLIKINRRPANPAKNQLPAESVPGAEDFGSGSISGEEALRGEGTALELHKPHSLRERRTQKEKFRT